MSSAAGNRSDKQAEEILARILKLSVFDCDGRIELTGKGDIQDAIAAGLNTLGEELKAKLAYLQNTEERINNILDILMEYTLMNFSRKIGLSAGGDEVDAIAAGLNTMAEELEFAITEQKKYANQLEQTNRLLVTNVDKLQAIFDNTPDAIIAASMDLRVLEWNRAAEHMYGFKKEEISGKPLEQFINTAFENKFSRLRIASSLERKGKWTGELIQYTKHRKKMTLSCSVCYLRNEEGMPVGFLAVNRDISDIRKTEKQMEVTTEELKRSNAELEQFAYIASHDLQEPLRMITSYVQLLEKRYRPKLDGDAIEFINYAVDGASRMQNLIQSLLEYSRINRSRVFEYVDLDETLEEVLRDLSVAIEESQAEITINKMPVVFGDRVLLGQLFFNLVGNAIKFKDKKPPKIGITCKQTENEFLFSVKDNGIGIQGQYKDKIFVIFQRLHTKDKYPGTGIGLAICKKIVEKHKGTIWVESEINKGSVFYFSIKKMRQTDQ